MRNIILIRIYNYRKNYCEEDGRAGQKVMCEEIRRKVCGGRLV